MPLKRILLALLPVILVTDAWAGDAEYRLGPLDQLQIKVYDLRNATGETYQWTAFNGDFVVSASGRVSLPLVGDLNALNKTTSELANDISTGLQAKVGLTAKPDASVQVTHFRPFYIAGDVEKPGEYEYRPNLTVLQAVSVAGGLERASSDAMLGYIRESLNTRGDLTLLLEDRLALLARQNRLSAEIAGAPTITFADELKNGASDPKIAQIMHDEQLLFDARISGLKTQLATIDQTKVVLNQEIVSLAAKDDSLGRQLDAVRKELAQVTGLVARGLTVLPRQLEMEQQTASFESNRLDVALATLRAKQDLTKADRDIVELKNARRSEALQDATDVRNKLTQTEDRIETAQRLLTHVEVRAPAALAAENAAGKSPDFVITRRVDGTPRDEIATQNDVVQPGDVVRVIGRSRADVLTAAGGRAGSEPRAVPRF